MFGGSGALGPDRLGCRGARPAPDSFEMAGSVTMEQEEAFPSLVA